MRRQVFSILYFWLGFYALNALLNVPEWVYSLIQSDVFAKELGLSLFKFFSYPQKSILFQHNGDFWLLFFPFLFLSKDRLFTRLVRILAATGLLFLFIYNGYYYLYQGLYSVHPIIKNDWIIVKEILPTFFNELSIKKGNYLMILIGFLLFSIGCFWGHAHLLSLVNYYHSPLIQRSTVADNSPPFSGKKGSIVNNKDLKNQLVPFWLIGLFLILVSNSIYQKNTKKEILNEENKISTKSVISINWIYPKVLKSWTLERKEPLGHLKKRWIYDLYLEKKLQQKPNIYLLFIESYGGVATLSNECSPKFNVLAPKLAQQLREKGWHSTSNYSKSTVIGGRSWLALTTAMIGARVEDQIQYNGLLADHQDFPHLIEFFNQQGYETVRASTMSSKDIDTLKMITIPNQFWGFDQRKMFTDIPYQGYSYDYYGGIPDQFTLGYLQKAILDTIQAPYFFTFITMNSHGPWSNAPPITDSWQALDTLQNPYPTGRPDLTMSIHQYWELMEYELKILTNFITTHDKENSIFILLGDHNPAGLEWKLYGKFNKWATPIHIISKDSTFVQSFKQHGFTAGMQVDTSTFTIMRHMGLQSLLTRQLLENYGEEGVVLPEYLPWGLK